MVLYYLDLSGGRIRYDDDPVLLRCRLRRVGAFPDTVSQTRRVEVQHEILLYFDRELRKDKGFLCQTRGSFLIDEDAGTQTSAAHSTIAMDVNANPRVARKEAVANEGFRANQSAVCVHRLTDEPGADGTAILANVLQPAIGLKAMV